MLIPEINERAAQLMEHINRQILLCDNQQDLLIFCFSMLNQSKIILDTTLGPEKRKQFFREHTND